MSEKNRVMREGVAVGLIGATSVAVWFGILDLFQGKFLATPVMLGGSLGSMFLNGGTPGEAAAFLSYTVFHFAAFLVVGIIFSWVVNGAEKVPSVLVGALGLLAVFEVWWVGGTFILAKGFGELTWLQVFIANIIGAAVMTFYMWRQHPKLASRVDAALAGAYE